MATKDIWRCGACRHYNEEPGAICLLCDKKRRLCRFCYHPKSPPKYFPDCRCSCHH